jgi:hypothetical protein
MIFDLIADAAAAGDDAEVVRLQEEAQRRIDSIKDPEVRQLAAEQMADSGMGKIKVDPVLREAQMSALKSLQEEGKARGYTDESRQVVEEGRQQAMRDEQAQRGAIMSNAQARGMGGSSSSINAQLQAQQAGADRMYSGNLQVAADARKRALAAMASSGQLAGQVRGQEFDEEAQKARAQDAINQWNAGTRQRTNEFNQDSEFRGAEFGLKKGMAGAQQTINRSETAAERADRMRRKWGKYGGAAGNVAGGLGSFGAGGGK